MRATEKALQELLRERAQIDRAIRILQELGEVRLPEDYRAVAARHPDNGPTVKARRTRAMNGRFGAMRLGVMSFLSSRTKPVTYAEIYDHVPRPDVYARRRRKAWETIVRSAVNNCEHQGHIKLDRTGGRLHPQIEATNAGRAWFQKVST